MKSLTDTFTLHNGTGIPCVGFGTAELRGEHGKRAFLTALETGYRHLDSAQMYYNEEMVGAAVKESGVPREEVFITTKLANDVRGYRETMDSLDESLRKLGTPYADLFLIHWPAPAPFKENWRQMNAESWRAMEDLLEAGKVRSIGVSNFRPEHTKALLKTARVKPMVNQIRLLPGYTQEDVVAYSREEGMLLEAYSPLGAGEIFSSREMKDLARKYGRTVAQLAIRWCLQRGFLPLPRSGNPDRIRENTGVFDFDISGEDLVRLDRVKT
ncbi:MAG TPA: aldo/keto reductase [Candidatus Limnocylindria bacterium]|nr:aldo/keto reductase [Candidatus Limnocylindria bacterium]